MTTRECIKVYRGVLANFWKVRLLFFKLANMSENTPPSSFRFMDQLPSEIRSKIFEHMIQHILQTFQTERKKSNFLKMPSVSFPDEPRILQIRCHLDESPWITLSKKYCSEYLREFLKQVQLGEDLQYWIELKIRRRDVFRAKGDVVMLRRVEEMKRMHSLGSCLQTIDYRLRTATFQSDFRKPFERLSAFMSGVYVFYHSSLFEEDRWRRTIEHFMAEPLKQLRRLHEKYDIPPNKISLHISYGSPSPRFAAYASRQDRHYNRDFAESLPEVQPRIWVADFDASVASLNQEIRLLRGPLKEKLQEARHRYPTPSPASDSVGALRAKIERDIMAIRRLHMRTIFDVMKFWRAHDGWYELDNMFRIAEAWGTEQKD